MMSEVARASNIPKGWILTKVSELYDIVGGGTPSTENETFWGGDIPWITSADIYGPKDIRPKRFITKEAIRKSTTTLVPAGSLIVVTRVGLGKVALAGSQLCFSQDSQALVDSSETLNPDYTLYYLSQAVQIFKYQNRGTTIAGVTKKQLADLAVPLPPLPEQHRIVAKIEELFTKLDAGVEALRAAQAQLVRYRQSILKAAVTGELTKEWREAHASELEPASELLARILRERREKWEADQLARMTAAGKPPKNDDWKKKYQEPAAPDTDELPNIPSTWCWTSLESITDALGGYAFKSSGFCERGEHQVIKMANVRMGKLDLSQRAAFLNMVETDILEKYSLRPGDVLVTLTGTRKKRDYGFIVAIKEQGKSLLLNQRIARLRPHGFVLPSYLEIAMQSESYRDRFFSYETGNVGQGNVGMAAVTVEAVAVAPLAEQSTIVEEVERLLSIADATERAIKESLKQSERLRQSILKKAFEGKLVQQDPSDEPAEALLARIREERAKRADARQKSKGAPSKRAPEAHGRKLFP